MDKVKEYHLSWNLPPEDEAEGLVTPNHPPEDRAAGIIFHVKKQQEIEKRKKKSEKKILEKS